MFEATYVGNWGRKMNRLRNANQGVVVGYANATQAQVQFPYANLNTATNSIAGAGTHAFLEYATNDGNTSYNALELSTRRNVVHGLGYQISYNLLACVCKLRGQSDWRVDPAERLRLQP